MVLVKIFLSSETHKPHERPDSSLCLPVTPGSKFAFGWLVAELVLWAEQKWKPKGDTHFIQLNEALHQWFSNFFVSGTLYVLKNIEDPKELLFTFGFIILEIKTEKKLKYLLFH